MTAENSAPEFKFNLDDEEPEAVLQDELRDLKIEKLAQKVTLLTILIPCMIGVILVIAYLDIKDRVTRTYDTGAIGVQKLSKDLESKFSSLSLEQAKIKDLQAQKLPDLEKQTAFLQSKLSKLQTSLEQMTKTSVSRDELTRVIEDVDQKVEKSSQSIRPDLQALSRLDDQIIEESRLISQKIATLSDSMTDLQGRFKTLQREIADLSEKAVSKEELELALKLKEIGYRQSLLDKTDQLGKEIKNLRQKLDRLEQGRNRDAGAAPAPPPATTSAPQQETPQPSDGATSGQTTAPAPVVESGGIVEQTIE